MVPVLWALGTAAVGHTFYQTNKSMQMDERARKKYAKAVARQLEAEALVKEKKELADMAIRKLANRKRAIISTSLVKFLDVYEKIMKIDFRPGEGMKELNKQLLLPEEAANIKRVSARIAEPLKDSEVIACMIKGGLVFGLGNAIMEDSKRNMAMASARMRTANVAYSEAEALGISLDTVADRCNKIADLLSKLNVLFVKSINNSLGIIEKNGYERSRYNEYERKSLMTCINVASTVKQIIDEPVIDKNGELAVETVKVLEIGNRFVQEVESL